MPTSRPHNKMGDKSAAKATKPDTHKKSRCSEDHADPKVAPCLADAPLLVITHCHDCLSLATPVKAQIQSRSPQEREKTTPKCR